MSERSTIGYLDSSNVWHQYGPGTDGEPIPTSTEVDLATGMTAQPVNAAITVNATTTVLIAAAAAGVKARKTQLLNTGAQTVFFAEGENATTAKFPLSVGAGFVSESLLAINGIVASGTGTVFVLAEARS